MGNFEYGFDRSKFLLQIVGQFNTKIGEFDPEKDKLMKNNPEKEKIMKEKLKMERLMMERVYNQWLAVLEKQKTPFNQMDITEKIRIVKECYRSFKSDEFRYGLRGVTPRKIAQDFGEEMLGILKRKYDMSDKFLPRLIPSKRNSKGINQKIVGVMPLKADDERGIPYPDLERGVIIQQTGELIYSDGITLINDIKRYEVTIPKSYCESITRTVFTKKIDYEQLSQDEKYAEAVFAELLSMNNIGRTNAGGYIGEIIKSNKMTIGSEEDKDGDFYTYQISDQYALTIDPMVVTAAKILEERQKPKAKEDDGR